MTNGAELLFLLGIIDDAKLFEQMFSPKSLQELFETRFAKSTSKGTDRLSGPQFATRAENEFAVAAKKCESGMYRFAPYLEILKTKGRHKPPRLVGIPTIRDRVVLSQLARYLAVLYPERVPKNVASTYVRQIAQDIKARSGTDTWVCSTDIRTFYDSIQRERLLKVLARRVESKPALALIKNALNTSTVPKHTPRRRYAEFRSERGVPQGLAISNILASIYMKEVDEAMKTLAVSYYRYVDDVLIYGEHLPVQKAFKSLGGRLRLRGLTLHPVGSGKTQIELLSKRFGYLGYVFVGSQITVRESTVERFLQSVAEKFSDFTHNKLKRLEKFKYLNEDRLKDIFLMELNERVTGAIHGHKRYGWIAYFSEITDLSLLHRLDHSIAGLFNRLPEFGRTAPLGLRKLRRAHWEMKFNPEGGYVRNYDLIVSLVQKLKFLEERGRVGPSEALTESQIEERYEKYLRTILAAMHADEGVTY